MAQPFGCCGCGGKRDDIWTFDLTQHDEREKLIPEVLSGTCVNII
jgi:hypothetical protein